MLKCVRQIWAIAILVLAATCGLSAGEVLEDTIERIVPLGPGGTFSLRNIDGTAQIYGSDENNVKIFAVKKAFSPERLNAIQIRIEARSDTVTIETSAPPKSGSGLSDRSGTVDYIISLPKTARIESVEVPNGELLIDGMSGSKIEASLGNGRLTTHNSFCDQAVRVRSGGLDIFFDWSEDKTITIDATIDDGNARAVIPSDASFEFDAHSEHGHVASDFTDVENRKRGGVSEVHEKIGQAPESKLKLRAINGNIRLSELIW